jgi:restriction endonuclease S subunit
MKLNKKTWQEYSFGDVAMQQKDSINRDSTDLDKYVAGEHMSTEDLHIREWGVIGEDYLGPAFHRKFCKGDILYGSRRTYLKKVAVAHFDGITANTTFVIKANDQVIEPKILPFLMLSDSFTEHSVKNSKGSVNPYINWKDISNYKFKLPPLPEQKRLADLLWSVDEAIVKYEYLLSHILLVRSSVLKNIYTIKGAKLVSISDLPIKEVNGMWKTKEKSDVMYVAIIRSTEIQAYGEINYDTVQRHKVKISQFKNKKLLNGDIIVERSGGGPDQPVGRVCYFDKIGEDYTFSNFTSVIRVLDKDQLMPKYLLNFLSFFYETRGTERLQKQTTGIRNLDYDLYRKIKIPLKSKREQKKCVDICERIDERRKNIIHQILLKKNIQKQLVNQVFK